MIKKKMNKRAKRAVIRACAAVFAALVMLAATGFAIVDLLRGSAAVADVTRLSSGDYVTVNIDMILGYFAEEYSRGSGETTAVYAIVPCNGRFCAVILPERYFDSAGVIYDSTYDFINGRTDSISSYILVTGTAEELTDETITMFYDWFGLNRDWMTEVGLTGGEVEDYADHISIIALRADTTGRLPSAWTWALTGAAWALLIYAAVVFLRLTLGKYAPKPEPEPEETPENTETEEDSDNEA